MTPGRAERRGAPRATGPAVAVLLVLLSFAALGGVLDNGFVNYDDDLYLTANPELARGPTLEGIRWAFTTTRGGNWHPLTWLSHLIDVRLFELRPGAHHAVGLAIHTANVLLLFALLCKLTGGLWESAFAAALFAVHPLHVESVAWAAERKDLLSTLLMLAAALAYARGLRRRGRPGIAVGLLFALALLAKPMPLTLPLLLLVLDWWPLGRWSPLAGRAGPWPRLPPWPLWREKAPLLLLSAASGAITWVVQAAGGAMEASAGVPLTARAANAVIACARYLRRCLWPDDLAAFYPYPWAGISPAAFAAALAVIVGIAALAAIQARRRPWFAAGLLWYLIALAPVLGIVQVGEQAMADRYTYVPLIGVFVAASRGLAVTAARGRRTALAIAAGALAAVALFGSLAARQVRTWHDGVALFSHALAVTESNYVAHNNLGTELLRRGRVAEALPHFEATIRLAPRSARGYRNLGLSLAQLGRHEEAAGRFRQALELDPRDAKVRRDLGRSLEALGRRSEAIAEWRAALGLDPRNARTLDLLGVALGRSGRAVEALALLERAAALDPADAAIRDHLAVARALARAPAAPGAPGVPRAHGP